jgi:hypothetical protein
MLQLHRDNVQVGTRRRFIRGVLFDFSPAGA